MRAHSRWFSSSSSYDDGVHFKKPTRERSIKRENTTLKKSEHKIKTEKTLKREN